MGKPSCKVAKLTYLGNAHTRICISDGVENAGSMRFRLGWQGARVAAGVYCGGGVCYQPLPGALRYAHLSAPRRQPRQDAGVAHAITLTYNSLKGCKGSGK